MSDAEAKQKTSLKSFMEEARSEMKKVAWPNRSSIISSTIVVLFIVAVSTLVVSLLDLSFARILNYFVRIF
jgi:preprotein translocase subunit SecE